MHDKGVTRAFYINQLGFNHAGNADFDGCLMLGKENSFL